VASNSLAEEQYKSSIGLLLLDAEEGDWTPPAESTGGKADDEDTESN
jgi:hypothetical protein